MDPVATKPVQVPVNAVQTNPPAQPATTTQPASQTNPAQIQTQAHQNPAAAQTNSPAQPAAQKTTTQPADPSLLALIKGSITLSDEEKTAYSTMVRSMPKEKLAQLKSILEAEKQAYDKIEKEHLIQMSEINAKHVREIKSFVRTNMESSEKAESEETLEANLGQLTNTNV